MSKNRCPVCESKAPKTKLGCISNHESMLTCPRCGTKLLVYVINGAVYLNPAPASFDF